MATIEGKNMDKHGLSSIRGFHKSGILHGQGRAVIAPNALWSHIKCEIILEGIFNNGYLEGPVRGLDTFGNLIFVGFYDKGLPRGSCWVCKIFIKVTMYGIIYFNCERSNIVLSMILSEFLAISQ